MPLGATGTASTTRARGPWARATRHAGTGCRARGDPVVHNDGAPALQVQPGSTLSVPESPEGEFRPLSPHDRLNIGAAECSRRHDNVVFDPDPVFAESAHRQLRLGRHAELAHDDHVERGSQHPCDLGRDGDPTPWQPEHDHLTSPQTARFEEQVAQTTSGIHAVMEQGRHP